MRLASVLAAAVLLAGLAPATHAGADDARIYLRDVPTIERTVEILAAQAERTKAPSVLVTFDFVTFVPPPGRSEYRYDHDYRGDLDRWLDALARWARDTKIPLHAVSSLGPLPVRVGEAGWRDRVQGALSPSAWGGGPRITPAVDWVRRCVPHGKGRKRPAMLVLIASEMTPERWGGDGGEAWRRSLLPVGRYWDEEAIGSVCARARCALWVVAPEVRFGDEVPVPTLPLLPWASRPQRPPPDLYGSWGSDPDEAYDQMLREDLERDLADEYPDPIERKKAIDEILGRPDDDGPTVPGGRDGETEDAPRVPRASGGRYTSGTPVLFPKWGGRVLFANDVPSGYGYWPYARAVARSKGRYVFYPYPASKWLDTCPRDDRLLAHLAPSLENAAAYATGYAGDRALGALCRAVTLVKGATPWFDENDARRASGWSAFTSTSPLSLDRSVRRRLVPSDPFFVGNAAAMRSSGAQLARLLPPYDQAIALLDEALARVGPGKAAAASRSVADLRLGRFWFALSALHLHALSLCLREIERFVPPGWDESKDEFAVSHLPMIKLSDCVDAYDGRTLGAAEDAHYPRALHRAWSPPGRERGPAYWEPGEVVAGQQGNVLTIPTGHPDFRARRAVHAVLEHLDPRLRPRALDTIEAALRVMEHHARTPWGWTVYYTEVQGFIFDPVDMGLDVRPRGGEDEDTPGRPPPSTTPGGSSPGGPVTPPR